MKAAPVYINPKCHRCKVPMQPYEKYASHITQNGRGIARRFDYHTKCLPPNLFHRTRGSKRAAESRSAGRVATD